MNASRPVALLLSCCLLGVAGQAQSTTHPSPKHTKAGVSCHDCHAVEKPSKKLVSSDSCVTCHGDMPAMEDYTRDKKPNPHKLPAEQKTSENHCLACHSQHK